EVPFLDVVIHSTVLAPDGRRMSKSLGTGIDPLDLIEKSGTDATRYGLLKNSLTQDVRFSYSAIEEGGKLTNKLWNAARLILTAGAAPGEPAPASVEERWILARLAEARRAVEGYLGEFDFAHAVGELGAPAGPRVAADRRAVAGGRRPVGGGRAHARAGGVDDLPPLRRAPAARGRRAAHLRGGGEAGAREGERQRRRRARAAAEGD